MKRIYLILMTVAAILMVGCNEETPQPIQVEDQEVSLQIGIQKPFATKATDELRFAGEDSVHNLTALVFTTNGGFVAGKREVAAPGKTALAIYDIVLPIGKYNILLLANTNAGIIDRAKGGFDALQENVESILDQKQNHLLMASKLFKNVQLVAYEEGVRLSYNFLLEDENANNEAAKIVSGIKVLKTETERNAYDYTETIAKKVELTRLAARIQLDEIKVAFPKDNDDLTYQFDGATFTLTSVFMANIRPQTYLTPVDGRTVGLFERVSTDPVYFRGGPATYTEQMQYIVPGSSIDTRFGKDYDAITLADGENHVFSYEVKDKADDMFFCYAFENQNVYNSTFTPGNPEATPPTVDVVTVTSNGDTRMIISGYITLGNGTQLAETYYHIPIKKGTQKVDRNHVYGVSVTIRGLGSDGPDLKDHYVAIQPVITVENWKYVKQVETDE
ncbi:hypothetical protein M2480_003128 [Parabacteroides sp. PFB2-12]|uniref:fimbrial protein n=1 Tax=unclassified Parabacteroides TaxID=2649774 RepID=UPI00247389E3|nr:MULTISPECIES: fimbrial protein [unclassified Parabacteroides]MDH6344213.1 hypothetical protein [Parabacteroides sp. PM6-13]MDH6392120.1 hypothetical protein [Parabacteroides sp. PFB2-12]